MHLKHKLAAALAAAVVLAASGGLHAAPRTPAAPHRHAVPQGLLASPSTCDPFADWDDDPDGSGGSNGGDDSTTNDLTGRGPIVRGPARVAAGAAAQVIGTTPEAIHRNFTGVVTRNLANAGTASRVARLSDAELAAIARAAAQGAPTERAGLLKLLASRLDGAALVRVARAFGRAPVEAAVAAYASPETRSAFAGAVAGLRAPPPEGGGGGRAPRPSPSPPRPTIDMTLREIYLEYRTAPVGSLSPSASLAETAMFAGRYLRGPAAGGGGHRHGDPPSHRGIRPRAR